MGWTAYSLEGSEHTNTDDLKTFIIEKEFILETVCNIKINYDYGIDTHIAHVVYTTKQDPNTPRATTLLIDTSQPHEILIKDVSARDHCDFPITWARKCSDGSPEDRTWIAGIEARNTQLRQAKAKRDARRRAEWLALLAEAETN